MACEKARPQIDAEGCSHTAEVAGKGCLSEAAAHSFLRNDDKCNGEITNGLVDRGETRPVLTLFFTELEMNGVANAKS
eukprot:6008620-Pleurochrysis_carterae.AAC.1